MKERILDINKNVAFEICKKALKEFNCDIADYDYELGMINAKKEGSFFSYGHEIKVIINTLQNGKIEILISSSSIGIQIIDWGTNLKNEEKIFDLITTSLL